MLRRTLVIVGVGAGAGTLWSGLDYYLLPLDERAFSPLHRLYAPTGLVGHGLGIVGTLFIVVGVCMYSLRKRVQGLRRWGKLKHWLEIHIFLCTLGPFLVLLHTTFRFGGIVAISFWSMALVVASGFFGRYLYVRIPKTVNGRFLTAAEVREEVNGLARRVERESGLPAADVEALLAPIRPRSSAGIAGALRLSLRDWPRRRSEHRRLDRALASAGVPTTIRGGLIGSILEEERLRRQAALLQPFQRAFRYWHTLHLPLAAVMMIILAVHVAVAIMLGYTWIF